MGNHTHGLEDKLEDKMKYKRALETDWVQPIRQGHKLACCDCGLVHVINYRLAPNVRGRGRKIQFMAKRDNRSTALMRRWMEKKNKQEWMKIKRRIMNEIVKIVSKEGK